MDGMLSSGEETMNNQNLIMKLIGGMIAQTNYMLGQMSRPLLGRTAPIWNPPWPGVVKSGGQPAQRMTERPKPSSSGAAERSPSRTPRTASSKETTKTKALQSLLNPSGYTASKISPEDLSHIIALYGSSVEDIYELGAGQRWMLEEGQLAVEGKIDGVIYTQRARRKSLFRHGAQ